VFAGGRDRVFHGFVGSDIRGEMHGRVCSGSVVHAVLNAGDLMTLLASGDVKLVDNHNKPVFDIQAPISWSSAHKLTIRATSGLLIGRSVTIEGKGGLDIASGSEQLLSYAPGASVTFWDTSSQLKVNGQSYMLADGMAGLAGPLSGYFALTKDYDAGPDGIYTDYPIHINAERTIGSAAALVMTDSRNSFRVPWKPQ